MVCLDTLSKSILFPLESQRYPYNTIMWVAGNERVVIFNADRHNMSFLTHLDQSGQAHMVNVGKKQNTQRIAIAKGRIVMQPSTLEWLQTHQHKKGDVLGVARIAAIMSSKRCAELIPLCHTILLTHVGVEFELNAQDSAVVIIVTTETVGQTGVEMEALTAVCTGLLTIYDMCKAVDRGMHIEDIGLVEKSGGRSGHWQRDAL